MHQVTDLPPLLAVRVRVDLLTGCWLWIGHGGRNDYGYAHVPGAPGGTSDEVHRISGCRWKCCCNPGHLEPVTKRENERRYVERRQHCRTPRRHPYPENRGTRMSEGVLRSYCLACNRERAQAWRDRQ